MKLPEDQDIFFMQQALELAKQGAFSARPNPQVGCILVKNGQVIAKGLHWQCGGPHAEVNALSQTTDAQGATCYVTLEPCSHVGRTGPCVDALIQAKVARVVIAGIDPNPQVQGKSIKALVNAGIDVKVGVLEQAAFTLNQGFFSRMQRGIPYVRAKVGMSLDGKVAMQNGESQWITSQASREQVQRWRAKSGAILTGSETVLKDNCRLTVRNPEKLGLTHEIEFKQPLRVVVDSKLKVSKDKAIFSEPSETIVATLGNSLTGNTASNGVGFPEKNGYVDLKALLEYLADREINDVLVEAGPTLVGAMLEQGLIDELLIYIAPKLLGNDAKPLATLKGITQLSEHIGGQFTQLEKVGDDLFVILKLNKEF
ncbi:MAG: bifunctional diaminohydroxyphosphoribosylaminopyrimidine deaminase/5-amino-6-(5-phosphoribosylamino)uracil reductase RibD [Proteobacteria bacterium]|nr:bifunctional diaminohydroxyphosphoribosylaminopyrimidine deaminase/5-amino-6-(5-phosphoribosylamino)uracil reductase RibD [Pseudomonadota bacterium]